VFAHHQGHLTCTLSSSRSPNSFPVLGVREHFCFVIPLSLHWMNAVLPSTMPTWIKNVIWIFQARFSFTYIFGALFVPFLFHYCKFSTRVKYFLSYLIHQIDLVQWTQPYPRQINTNETDTPVNLILYLPQCYIVVRSHSILLITVYIDFNCKASAVSD